MSGDYWDDCETWSADRLAEYQLAQLRLQLEAIDRAGAHYHVAWRSAGWQPGDLKTLDDLTGLPLTTKADFQVSVASHPPYGDLLGVPEQRIARIHFSSGTTATPTPAAWTVEDLERWADLYARMAWSQGVRPGDVYQCLFSYAWFVGGLGATAGYTRLGATVIPGGSGDSKRQIETIFRFATTALGGTPSFLLHLAETAERIGRSLTDSHVRHVMVGGEPGGAIPATRRLLEERYGARCFDGYGCLEFQPIAWECAEQAGGHLAEDFVYAEVLDAATNEPVADGEAGVLVLTHLDKHAYPLVRWWTGDVVRLDRSRCACGRTHARLAGGVAGRADDMLVIRGVNVFPSAVEEVVRREPGASGEFRILLDPDLVDEATGYHTGFRLQVEAEPEAPTDLAERLAEVVHRDLKVRATVEVLETGRLERQTHKTNRVVRVEREETAVGR